MILEEPDTAINSSYYFQWLPHSQDLRQRMPTLISPSLETRSCDAQSAVDIKVLGLSFHTGRKMESYYFSSSLLLSPPPPQPPLPPIIITTTNTIDDKYNYVSTSLFLDHCKKGWVVWQTLRTGGWYDLMSKVHEAQKESTVRSYWEMPQRNGHIFSKRAKIEMKPSE